MTSANIPEKGLSNLWCVVRLQNKISWNIYDFELFLHLTSLAQGARSSVFLAISIPTLEQTQPLVQWVYQLLFHPFKVVISISVYVRNTWSVHLDTFLVTKFSTVLLGWQLHQAVYISQSFSSQNRVQCQVSDVTGCPSGFSSTVFIQTWNKVFLFHHLKNWGAL